MTLKKLWVQRPYQRELLYQFIREGSFSPLISQILINKGFSEISSAYKFLYPQLSDFANPFEIPEMDLAVKRIEDSLQGEERIGIYGDSDADGIIGSYVLYDFLSKISKKEPLVLLPDKNKEGYGFHKKYLPFFKANGVKLIITVDVGISASDTVEEAKALGLDVIITDHHEVREKPSSIVVTSKLTSRDSPFHYLCGAGVALTLIRALRSHLYQRGFFSEKRPPSLREYLELVAIATLADMVPLLGENRTITYFGFKDLNDPFHPALKALIQSLGLRPPLTEEDLHFRIISSINACGRLGKAEVFFNFLKSFNPQERESYLRELQNLNQERQILESELWERVQKEIEVEENLPILLALFEGLPRAMLGLLANRLKNRYNRPVLILSMENGLAYGSARSPEGIDLLEMLWNLRDCFLELGGHQRAFGFKISKEKIPELKSKIREIEIIRPKGSDVLHLDAITSISEILLEDNQYSLREMQPYGISHHPPLLAVRGFEVRSHEIIKDKHTKFILKEGLKEISAIYFNDILPSKVKMLAVTPYLNNFSQRMELKIEDYRF
ncbi:MAG: single-stranded-DNA-specific exonuclease RecJ [Caldimicrobium sp.]|nr:single-stranded-DNA-specific exonuclease RecJ [Caldimicrobium sp.]